MLNEFEVVGLPDVQRSEDRRGIAINRVGICDLEYPIQISIGPTSQTTVAKIRMSVDLPSHMKGTHMSRFVEALEEIRDKVSVASLVDLAARLQSRLDSNSCDITFEFPYFYSTLSPVSRRHSMMSCQCKLAVSTELGSPEVTIKVIVPVMSLCPCSKEISEYGAHNQRGYLSLLLRLQETDGEWPSVTVEDLVSIAERSASSPVYSLLKRPDERHVTMASYENPQFVEDIARNASIYLRMRDWGGIHHVQAVNVESIHNHSAFAEIFSPEFSERV